MSTGVIASRLPRTSRPASAEWIEFECRVFALARTPVVDVLNVPGISTLPRCQAENYRPDSARSDVSLLIGAVKEFIDAHADEDLDLDRIARAAGLSKFHFARIFNEVEGRTPWAYVRDARVRRAKELLETDLPLADVALSSGFYDQSHFTRSFREAEGETPGHYRRRRKNIQDRPAIHP